MLNSVPATGDRRQTGGQQTDPGGGTEKGSLHLLSTARAAGCFPAQACAPTHHQLAGRGLMMSSLVQVEDLEQARHHGVKKAKSERE